MIKTVAYLFFFVLSYITAKKYLKKPSNLEKAKEIWSKFLEFILPFDVTRELSNLKQKSFDALHDESAISDLLMYSHYQQEEEGDDKFGVYTLATGRQGFIVEISPPPFLGEDTERTIESVLGALERKDLFVNFFTYASPNIERILENYKQMHQCETNIENPDILKALINERINSYRNWSEESIMGDTADLRIRNFTTLVSVVFPHGTKLTEIKSAFLNLKGSIGRLSPKNFRADKLLVMMHDILKPGEKLLESEVDLYRKMNSQFAQGVKITLDPDSGDMRIGNNVYARALTTKKFPKRVRIEEMQGALFEPLRSDLQNPIPCPFFTALTIHMEDPKKAKKRILNHCRRNLKQTSKMNYEQRKSHPDIEELRDEATRTIEYIEQDGQVPYSGMWSMVLFDKSKERLDEYCGAVKKRFRDIPTIWELQDESSSIIALLTMLYSLPLNVYQPMRHLLRYRFDLLFKANNAAIAPIISGFKGHADANNIYFTGEMQAFAISPFASTSNYNTVVVGPPGSGKSFFTNDYIYNALGNSWRVWVFDLGESYKNLNEEFGGQFLQFTDKTKICLNFFTHMNTIKRRIVDEVQSFHHVEFNMSTRKDNAGMVEMIHEDEFETIVPMIGIMAGMDLRSTNNYDTDDSEEEKAKKKVLSAIIESALNVAFLRAGRDAGMRDVFEVVLEIRTRMLEKGYGVSASLAEQLASSLGAYGQESGKFYHYFNGAFNVNMDNWFFLLEQEELKNKGELLEVVCFGFLQRIAQISFLPENRGYRKLIVFDEAAPLLKSELFVHYLDDFSRRLRKYNGALMVVTQYISDFFFSSRAKSLFQGAAAQIYLPQERSKIEAAVNEGHITLDEFQIELLKSLYSRPPHYGEFLYKQGDLVVVGRLKVTAMEYALFTTNPADRAKRESIRERHGITTSDALFVFAKTNFEKMSENEALRLLAKRNQQINSKYWAEKLNYAIRKKTVMPYAQPIVDKNNEVRAFEVLMRVVDDEGKVFSPGAFDAIARERNLYARLQMQMLEKTFNYFQNFGVDFSINLDRQEIMNKDFMQFLVSKIQDSAISRFLIIEVDTAMLDNEIIKRLSILRKHNVRFALDKANLDNMNLKQAISMAPAFIKIDSTVAQKMAEKENQDAEALMIGNISSLMGTETIAVHVKDKKTFESGQLLGIHYFQGYYWSEPLPIDQIEQRFQLFERSA